MTCVAELSADSSGRTIVLTRNPQIDQPNSNTYREYRRIGSWLSGGFPIYA